MNLSTSQLKKSLIPIGADRKDWTSLVGSCLITASLYDILNSYIASIGLNIVTDQTLKGLGTQASKLGLASQGASVGQVLTYNGTTWVPATPAYNAQTITFNSPFLTISGGNTISLAALLDSPQILSVSGFELSISDGNTVNLPASWQTLNLIGNSLSIGPNGNSVNLATLAGGYSIIQTADTPVTSRNTLNFVNSPSFIITDDAINSRTNVTLDPSLIQISLITPASGNLMYYNGTSWTSATPVKYTQTDITGTVVNLPSLPLSLLPIDIYINGLLKEEGVDYTLTGVTLNLVFDLIASDKITSKYFN